MTVTYDVGKNDITTGRSSVTALGIIAYWYGAGGHNDTNMIMAVAVALATSHGDTGYVQGNQIGLWGIAPREAGFPTHAIAKDLVNPKINAVQAWAISNMGNTWSSFPAAFDGKTYLGPNAPFRAYLNVVMQANGAPGLSADQAKEWPKDNPFGSGTNFTPGQVAQTIGDAITPSDPLKQIADAVGFLGDIMKSFFDVIRWFTSPENLWRVAKFFIGSGLIYFGGTSLIKGIPLGKGIQDTVGKAAMVAAL
jgi:hypothetical protein